MDEALSPTAILVIFVAVVVAVVTAIALNRTAHAKKEIRLDNTPPKPSETSNHVLASALREKLERLPVRAGDRENTMQFISKIVEEETEQRLKEVKQEYSVKYQVMMQEKNKEVDGVKREFSKTLEKYDEVKREYKRVEVEKKNTEAVVRSIAEGLVVVNQ